MIENKNIFAGKFYSTELYKHVDAIKFVSDYEVKFTLSEKINNLHSRLATLKREFIELYDVKVQGDERRGKTLHLITMTFPSDIPKEEIEIWFYFILGDKEKTKKEFEDKFQIVKIKEPAPQKKIDINTQFHGSTQFYRAIQCLSFAGRKVTFKTPFDKVSRLHERISVLAQYKPELYLINYQEKGLEKPAGEFPLQLHVMIFPDEISEPDIKKNFYLIVGDKENFEKEVAQQFNPVTADDNNNNTDYTKDEEYLKILSELNDDLDEYKSQQKREGDIQYNDSKRYKMDPTITINNNQSTESPTQNFLNLSAIFNLFPSSTQNTDSCDNDAKEDENNITNDGRS